MDKVCRISQEGSVEARLWGCLLAEILRLGSCYRQRGDDRRFLRCEAVLKTLEALIQRHGTDRGLAVGELLKGARAQETGAEYETDLLAEAAGWWECAHASFQLASLYGLGGQAPELALRLADVHREVRAGIACIYPDEAGKNLIRMVLAQPDPEDFHVWVRVHLPTVPIESLVEDVV